MATHKAQARWNGNLAKGDGQMKVGGQSFSFSAKTRFGGAEGGSPEQLIGAAHAGCFSMALSHALAGEGYEPKRVETKATVYVEEDGDGSFEINRIVLESEAEVPDIDDATFLRISNDAKEGCPVSRLVKGAKIELQATLLEKA